MVKNIKYFSCNKIGKSQGLEVFPLGGHIKLNVGSRLSLEP